MAATSETVSSCAGTAGQRRKKLKKLHQEEKENIRKFREDFKTSFDGLVVSMRNENMLTAIEALSRYEEKLHFAEDADNATLVRIYTDKVELIKQEIERMKNATTHATCDASTIGTASVREVPSVVGGENLNEDDE